MNIEEKIEAEAETVVIWVRLHLKKMQESFFRCGMPFTKEFRRIEVDPATKKRLDEEQMLEVSETDPAESIQPAAGDSAPLDPSPAQDGKAPPADAAPEAGAADPSTASDAPADDAPVADAQAADESAADTAKGKKK